MTQPRIQNFSVPANSDQEVTFFVVSTVPGDTLAGATVYWRAYEQKFGIVDPAIPPVIEKTSNSNGGVEILSSPAMTFRVSINKADTAARLRNYYHEATVIAADGSSYPPTCGIMTVTATENRVP